MKVVKRDGSVEKFSKPKVKRALDGAFKETTGKSCPAKFLNTVVNELMDFRYREDPTEKNGFSVQSRSSVNVEEIQDIIEKQLMINGYHDVAREFIIYRQEHKEIRDWAEKQIEYIENYKNSYNTADATIDDNSNMACKNIAVLNNEIHKEDNLLLNRYMVTQKLKELYPDFDAKQYPKDLDSHIIYKHDESSFAGAIAPYTYSAKEVLHVKYMGEQLLIPFDALWDTIDEEPTLVDKDKEVYQKYPEGLFVHDKDNSWTEVTVITKKKRHRPLVHVKTAFGEDLVCTDNHPLITDIENIDNTTPAIDSLGKMQFKTGERLEFGGRTIIDTSECPYTSEHTESYSFNTNEHTNNWVKRYVKADWNLGYVVGFFIGDGHYDNSGHNISFTQRERETLLDINSKIYESMGVAGRIYIKSSGPDVPECHGLYISSDYLWWILRDLLKVEDKSPTKTLPFNILEWNEEFAKGVICGVIDSDGDVRGNTATIRLSSRAATLQISYLARHFGMGVGNGFIRAPFVSRMDQYKTNYSLWRVNCNFRDDKEVLGKFRKSNRLNTVSKWIKYKPTGSAKITNVIELDENDGFINQNEYIYDITTESHTFSLNNLIVHNCVALTMYPFLENGIREVGGLSAAPKNLDSFCGMYVNLIFAVSSQFAGAVATPEFLLYFDYFARKEWGNDYWKCPEKVAKLRYKDSGESEEVSIEKQIHQYFQQVVYTINQPAAARGMQSAFVNFSYFDHPFFDGMFGSFYFPDGTQPMWESFNWLQREFMQWFNEERLRCVLTFPVESFALVYKDGKFLDEESAEFVAEEYARGHSFFTYISDTVDSLSSCCRLKNKLTTKEFNFTNGNIGLQTGSKSVITLNLSRIVQDWALTEEIEERITENTWTSEELDSHLDSLCSYLGEILERVYKYHTAYDSILRDMESAHLLPVYSAGFINLNKQYLTIGINGLNEMAEYLGIPCKDSEKYSKLCQKVFGYIKSKNLEHKTKETMFNTECVPAESLAIKNYNWDKADGYWVPEDRNLYASYIFIPSDKSLSILDKIRLHGKDYIGDYLDGGSAVHLNLAEHLSKDQYAKILRIAAEEGCQYFTFNIPNSECSECHYITKHPISKCPKCGSEKIYSYTRIIGYLTKIQNWSEGRRIEGATRVYENKEDIDKIL